jgi:hypothetical protein
MKDDKVYLLAELTILPEFMEEVKAILKEALIPTLQEPGCEAVPPRTGLYKAAVRVAGRQGVRSANPDQVERTLTMGTPYVMSTSLRILAKSPPPARGGGW